MGCNSSAPQDPSALQLTPRDLATLEKTDDRVADSILHSAGDRAAAAAAGAAPAAAHSSRVATRHNVDDVVQLTDAACRRHRVDPGSRVRILSIHTRGRYGTVPVDATAAEIVRPPTGTRASSRRKCPTERVAQGTTAERGETDWTRHPEYKFVRGGEIEGHVTYSAATRRRKAAASDDDPCRTCGARPPAVAFGRFASSGARKGTCEPCLAKRHAARQKPPNAMDVDVDADALERRPPNAMDVDDDPQDRAIDAEEAERRSGTAVMVAHDALDMAQAAVAAVTAAVADVDVQARAIGAEEAERRSGAAVAVAHDALDVAQAAVAAVTAVVAEIIPKVVEFEKNACLAEVRQFDLFVCTRRPQDGDDARISLLVQGQPGGLWWVRSEDFAGACPFGLATFASVKDAHDAADALRGDDAITYLNGGLKYSHLFELRSPPP